MTIVTAERDTADVDLAVTGAARQRRVVDGAAPGGRGDRACARRPRRSPALGTDVAESDRDGRSSSGSPPGLRRQPAHPNSPACCAAPAAADLVVAPAVLRPALHAGRAA